MNTTDTNRLSYRKIRNDVHKYLNNKLAAVFLALMFYADYKTGESHVTHETLRKKTGFPESSLKRYLKQLEEKGFTHRHSYYRGKTAQGKPRHLTDYYTQIPDTCYIMADRKLLDMQIDSLELKEQSFIKGFLLMLKCVCLNFTDTTLFGYRELEENMNLSYATISNLMKQCMEYDLVYPNKDGQGYTITKGLFYNGYPPIEIPENERDWHKEIYTAIYEFCKSRRVICPPYEHRLVSRISMVCGCAEGVTERLERKIKKLPDDIGSLNYFIRIIEGKALEPEPEKPKTAVYLD